MLKTTKKTIHIDSADRDVIKYPTNGEYTVHLPRTYENVTSLRLKGAEFAGASGTSFNPTNVSDLSVWLDSSDTSTLFQQSDGTQPITANGQTVRLWKDKTTNNNNFSNSQGTASYSSGFGVVFSSANSILRSSNSINLLNSTTVFVVSKLMTGALDFNMLIAFPDIQSNDYSIRFINGVLRGTPASSGNANDFGNNNYYVNGIYNPNLGSSVYTNYTIIDAKNSSGNTGPTNISLSSDLAPGGISRHYQGYIQEVLIYNTTPTNTERQQIEGYLAWKWNLQTSLPSDHPYYSVQVGQGGGIFNHNYTSGLSLLNDTAISNPMYYFLMELVGLNKSDETRIGGDKSSFIDKYFAKIPNTQNGSGLIVYNDKNLQENIAKYNPPIELFDRLNIKLRTHGQQDGSGFIYFTNNYNLTFEVECLENSMEIDEK
jgi:hypothetical protein